MTTLAWTLAGVIVVGLAVLYVLLREQGPNPIIVLLGRYTVVPFVLLALAPVVLLGLWLQPVKTILGLAAIVWIGIIVGLIVGWDLGTIGRAVRRIRIRSMWPSVARSSGLGVRNDCRSKSWPGGVTTTVVDAQVIEHLPRIWHGRAMANGSGVTYRLRPAKGGTIGDVQERTTALTAAFGVRRIVIVTGIRANRAEFKVLYRDALTGGE